MHKKLKKYKKSNLLFFKFCEKTPISLSFFIVINIKK
jgi:hypothetical protein